VAWIVPTDNLDEANFTPEMGVYGRQNKVSLPLTGKANKLAVSTSSAPPRCTMTAEPNIQDVQVPITQAPSEVKEIIERVLQLEKDKLYMKVPRGINDDIIKVIKEIVR